MYASFYRLSASLLFCCVAMGTAIASQTVRPDRVRRIYVEQFITQAGSEAFHDAVIAELRKVKSFTIAPEKTSADAILGGGGEIWVKGYLSHNPRLGKVPPTGAPVYTGFLSVELKDLNGETLWSYLATPPAVSADVARDLSLRIVKNLTASLDHPESLARPASSPQPTTILQGAGATFPYPVYTKWFTNYHLENPTLQIDYEPIGSEAGIRRLIAHSVDFGASDSPKAIHELIPGDEKDYVFFPSVTGAVVPVVNLPGVRKDIAFTPEALAGIYLGSITRWNDPLLTRANRGVRLPDLEITVVHRGDGSGTSYVFTDYLSNTSTKWKAQVGASLTPGWPVGQAAHGNDGVANMVQEKAGAIGYVEFIYALQHHLSFGRVQNRNGEFTLASLESISAAATRSSVGASSNRDDFGVSLVDVPGPGVYPISSFTWIVIRPQSLNGTKRSAMIGFLQWMLGPGQRQAAALGYVALPKEILRKETAAIGQLQ